MSLIDLKLEQEYHTVFDDVVDSFFIPCLKEASSYNRITGFFSGMTFQMLGIGLSQFVKHSGKIKLIISTRLSEAEAEAISEGYEERELIKRRVDSMFNDPTDEFEKGYLSLLTYLVANNVLDVRVVVLDSKYTNAMEHEKMGYFMDDAGNTVAFSGSGNETPFGLEHNLEQFDVYCSWKGDDPGSRCFKKQVYFNNLWNGMKCGVKTFDFMDAIKAKLLKYQNCLSDDQLAELDLKYIAKMRQKRLNIDDGLPSMGKIQLHNYQSEAIEELRKNNYRGYFDMATGTGKTFTALGGIVRLVHDKNIKTPSFLLLIVVPYMHLVTQWANDCESFGIKPLLAFGPSSKWKRAFEEKVISINLKQSKFECVIITTSSLLHDFVIKSLNDEKTLKRTIFVADEAHNLGAGKIKSVLDMNFRYRIGLSATMDRHHDEAGTQKLYSFFEHCCIHYDLGRAIKEGFLSHYHYTPIPVFLDEDELDQYLQLTKKIEKYSSYADPDECEPLKKLLLKRALIVAGCRSKIGALKEAIKPFRSSHYSLVYCGAVSYENASDKSEHTQLLTVMNMLRNELGMNVEKFTSEEGIEERETIKKHFESKFINAIVAIKCLDEGVNIPCIQRAFILASSTNPKEYIQRRGRVLRLFDPKEKQFAEIYDFVVLSRPFHELSLIDEEQLKRESSLAKRELARVEEFSRLSDNSFDSQKLISDIREAYHLEDFNLENGDGF